VSSGKGRRRSAVRTDPEPPDDEVTASVSPEGEDLGPFDEDERTEGGEADAEAAVSDDDEGEETLTDPPDAPDDDAREDATPVTASAAQGSLDPDSYRALAAKLLKSGHKARAAVIAELAAALDGSGGSQAPAPRLLLKASDRAVLRHPLLRDEASALLGTVARRLVRVAGGDRSQERYEEFREELGDGGPAAAEALAVAVRVLGLAPTPVRVGDHPGPPFSLICADGPCILVGKLAVEHQLPGAELRFFAGRALFTQAPDLMALRTVRKEGLMRGLQLLEQVLQQHGHLPPEAGPLQEGLDPAHRERLKPLLHKARRKLAVQAWMDGARHTANRAGLVVCGAIAPAVVALKSKQAQRAELIELVRFASSPAYAALRTRP
jgi:hypothetical protein